MVKELAKVIATVVIAIHGVAPANTAAANTTIVNTTAGESPSTVTETKATMPAFSIAYTVENDYITGGKAKLTLTPHEDQYQLLLETRPTGVFRLSDKGKIKEVAMLDTLTPPFLASDYSYTNFGDKKRSYQSVYNRESGKATITRRGTTEQFDIDTTAIDRISTTLMVMQQLRDSPQMDGFSIPMIDQNEIQQVEFIARGQEPLNTRLGKLVTTRVDRKRSGSSRHTVTWFAALGQQGLPVPVQIEHFKRGKLTVRLKIQDFSIGE